MLDLFPFVYYSNSCHKYLYLFKLIRSASNLTAVTELQQIHPILKPSEEAGVATRSSWEETEVHQVMLEKVLNKML